MRPSMVIVDGLLLFINNDYVSVKTNGDLQ